ncbi:MAG: hypothetical protein A4S09_01145 [Proteobacteria bacterium SG_bin7]|nr:MAG: hypothetical protein A4S09_01145 [Proteobacteria bacterium SG_bin7]
MKNILLACSLVFTMLATAMAEDSRQAADTLYSQREASETGVQKAIDAADMYLRLATNAKSNEKNSLLISASRAYYFVGTFKADKKQKIEIFEKGMAAAQTVLTAYLPELKQQNLEAVAKEVLDKVNPNEVLELSHALYYEGINLGSWAEANGITQSLSKWPTLRNYMLLVNLLKKEDINLYGASRVLGRAYYRLPVIAGGDKDKARTYLSAAFNNTQQGGISRSGNNNVFYAEFLYNSEKKKDEAIKLLKAFVAANADTLDPDSIPETKVAQGTAKKLLADWEE